MPASVPICASRIRAAAIANSRSGRTRLFQARTICSHFRRRVGVEAIQISLAVFKGLFLGLWPDHGRTPRHGWPAGALAVFPLQGPAPTSVRLASSSGWTRPVGKSSADNWKAERNGSRFAAPSLRLLQLVCQATTKQGKPREPQVALLEIDDGPADRQNTAKAQQSSQLLSLPTDQLPPLRIQVVPPHQERARRARGPLPQGPLRSIG